MFLNTGTQRRWYSQRDGQQHASGAFLIVFDRWEQRDDIPVLKQEKLANGRGALRAAVRHVKLHQCGHWMMGEAHLNGIRVGLSGSYGSDGLPVDVTGHPGVSWDDLLPLPDELVEEYWDGDGWNSCGKEAPAMNEWALANITALRRAGSGR
jgi:hypothetical protein